jgi:hypothetical protein
VFTLSSIKLQAKSLIILFKYKITSKMALRGQEEQAEIKIKSD